VTVVTSIDHDNLVSPADKPTSDQNGTLQPDKSHSDASPQEPPRLDQSGSEVSTTSSISSSSPVTSTGQQGDGDKNGREDNKSKCASDIDEYRKKNADRYPR
jgi:hypothetical protein